MPWGILAPLAGAAIGELFGGGGASNAQPTLPKDLQPLRSQNIGLLQYLLGFNQPGSPFGQQQAPQQTSGTPRPGGPTPFRNPNGIYFGQTPGNPWQGIGGIPYAPPPQGSLPASQGGPIQRGGSTAGNAPGGAPQGLPPSVGGMSPTGGQMANLGGGGVGMRPGGQTITSTNGPGGLVNTGYQTQGGQYPAYSALPQPGSDPNSPLGRLESFFGQLGTPTTALQQQSLGGISQFLNSNPYGQSNSALQGILGGQGYNETNQAFRDVGSANYFGGAQNAFGGAQDYFQGLGGQNLFGGAENAFRQAGQANNFGDAEGVFKRLETYNPFGAAQTSLEGILGSNPGQGMLEALRPSFERNLAAANQQGGRFGSANAILRSRAVDDYNLLGAQALQRGVDQQIAGAGQLGMMGNSLLGARANAGQGLLGVGQGRTGQQLGAAQGLLGGAQGRLQQGLGVGQGLLGAGQGMLGVGQGQLDQGLGSARGLGSMAQSLMGNQLGAAGQLSQNQNNMFNALQGGYQTGSAQAQQEAQRQQQAIQMLQGLLGTSFGATFGAPTSVSPTGAQTGAGIGSSIGQILAMYGGGGGMIPGGGQANVWGPASQYHF